MFIVIARLVRAIQLKGGQPLDHRDKPGDDDRGSQSGQNFGAFPLAALAITA